MNYVDEILPQPNYSDSPITWTVLGNYVIYDRCDYIKDSL